MNSSNPEPWRRLRDLEPPLGSRRRVIAEALGELDTRRAMGATSRRPWPIYVMAGAAAASLFFVYFGLKSSSQAPMHLASAQETQNSIKSASGDKPESTKPESTIPESTKPKSTKPKSNLQEVSAPELFVAAEDQLSVRLPSAEIVVAGPALITVESTAIRISEGRMTVAGYALVRSPACDVQVKGQAKVEVVVDSLQVVVSSGSVKAIRGSCTVSHVQDLLAGARAKTQPVQAKPAHVKNDLASIPLDVSPIKGEVSALRVQLEEYKRIRALTSPKRIIASQEAFIQRWPKSLFRQEAEMQIAWNLFETGQYAKAQARVQTFMRRYPRSAHAEKLRKYAAQAESKLE